MVAPKEESIDDLMRVIHLRGNSLIKDYSNFESALQADHNRCERLIHILESEDQEHLIQHLPNQLIKNQEETESKINKNKLFLNKIQEELIKARESEKDMDTLIVQYERKKHDLQRKISHWSEKTKKLEEHRDKILIYKLLTGISFSYEGSTVSGCVVNRNSKKIKPFNLNPEQLSQKQITDALYDVIKKTSIEGTEVSE